MIVWRAVPYLRGDNPAGELAYDERGIVVGGVYPETGLRRIRFKAWANLGSFDTLEEARRAVEETKK